MLVLYATILINISIYVTQWIIIREIIVMTPGKSVIQGTSVKSWLFRWCITSTIFICRRQLCFILLPIAAQQKFVVIFPRIPDEIICGERWYDEARDKTVIDCHGVPWLFCISAKIRIFFADSKQSKGISNAKWILFINSVHPDTKYSCPSESPSS